jgi:hypothetical protein
MGKGGSWYFQKMQKIKKFRRKQNYHLPRAGVADFSTMKAEMIKGGRTPDSNPIEPELKHLFDNNRRPRNLSQVVQGERMQGTTVWRPLTVDEDQRRRLLVLVCGNQHIFVRVCKLTDTYIRSVLFDTRGEAMGAYKYGRFYWRKEVYALPGKVSRD